MKNISLASIDQYTFNTPLDKFRYEAWRIINQYIDTLNTIAEVQDFFGDVLSLPDTRMIILIANNETDLLLAMCQTLGYTPQQVEAWLENYTGNPDESVVQLESEDNQQENQHVTDTNELESEDSPEVHDTLRSSERQDKLADDNLFAPSDSVE